MFGQAAGCQAHEVNQEIQDGEGIKLADTLGHRPPTAHGTQIWRPGTGQDPARYLISDENLYHARPSIQSGASVFVFPIGVEGFRRSGQALLGKHYYIGDDDVDVQVVHMDEARIELSGMFPGLTAVENMRELTGLLASKTPERGKILYMPGIFTRIQYVNIDNYDFVHDAEDRTHSISYTLQFLRTGIGRRIRDPHGKPPNANPGTKQKGRRRGQHYLRRVHLKHGLQTLRQVAKQAYSNSDLWTLVLDLNLNLIHRLAPNVPRHQLPNHRFPIGTELKV
jgi:hypothetical protein